MKNKPVVDLNWLCNWLEENSSGIYRPAREAAHVIRSMSSEIESLRTQLKAAQEQEPVGYADLSRVNDRDAPRLTSEHFTESQSPVYSAPIPAQQSPALPDKTEYVPISVDMKSVFIDGFGLLPIQYPEQSPAVPNSSMVSLLRKVWKHGFDAENYDDIDFCNEITIAQSDDGKQSPTVTQGELIKGEAYQAGLWSMINAEAMIEDGNVINGQSPAVVVPELDYVDGDILPPVGASVSIHLASCDKWVDHTVVGYYVWRPLGQVSDSYSRVFVRVVDEQGVLNARLLKDVKWDKNTPLRQIQSHRITEQDAYDIILNFYWFTEAFKNKHGNNPSVFEWRDAEGRALLDKLNNIARADQQSPAVAQGELIKGEAYQAGLWSMSNAEAMIEDGNAINGQSPAVPVPDVEALKKVWGKGYDTGHNDGIGCGHDLAPRCRHDSSKEASDNVDEIIACLAIASTRITEQDAREIVNSFNHWFAKPNLRVPGIIRNHDSEVFPVFMDEEGRALLDKLNNIARAEE